MNWSTAETVRTLVETMAYQVFHIIFQDTHHSDHHCQVVAQDKTEVLKKVETFLNRKKADHSTISVMNEDDFEAAFKSALKPYYIIFQNGTRRFCCILATNPLEAETEFKKRFTAIPSFTVTDKHSFDRLLIGGKWKEIPLPINQN